MSVPKLRFKEFKDQWISQNFYDCVKISAKLIEPNQDDYLNLPHIGPGNIEKFTGRLLDFNLVKDENLISGKFHFNNTDIIYGKINPQLSKVAFPKFEGLCSADSYPISSIEGKILPGFLFQVLLHSRFFKFAKSVSMRTGMPKINRDELGHFKFILPTIEEQKQIATFFSLLDLKVQKQKEKVELLKKYQKGLMQKIFKQEFRFKKYNGQEYPEWKKVQLNQVAEKITEKNKDFRVENVVSNSAKLGLVPQHDYFDKDIANRQNTDGYYVISEGDFVYNPRISTEAPYGPINIYEFTEQGIVSPLYLCFKVKNINRKFLFYYFQTNLWYKFIYLHGDSGARHDRISIKDSEFFKLQVVYPTLEEQNKIVQFLKTIEDKLKLETNKLELLQNQKQGLMQQMFI